MPPPRVTHRDRRRRFLEPMAGWSQRVPPAVLRALVASAFAGLPSFDDRFGSLALPALCAGMAVLLAAGAWVIYQSEARGSWPLSATDVVTAAALIPAVAVASGIEVADIQLGGQGPHFLAAAVAVVAIVGIIALVAVMLALGDPASASLAVLPAPLVVAAVIGGAERFAAMELGQGVSAAWMAAALATVAEGVVSPRSRVLVAPVAFALFAIAIAFVARTGAGADVRAANGAIAFLATGAAGGALLLVPALAQRGTRAVRR